MRGAHRGAGQRCWRRARGTPRHRGRGRCWCPPRWRPPARARARGGEVGPARVGAGRAHEHPARLPVGCGCQYGGENMSADQAQGVISREAGALHAAQQTDLSVKLLPDFALSSGHQCLAESGVFYAREGRERPRTRAGGQGCGARPLRSRHCAWHARATDSPGLRPTPAAHRFQRLSFRPASPRVSLVAVTHGDGHSHHRMIKTALATGRGGCRAGGGRLCGSAIHEHQSERSGRAARQLLASLAADWGAVCLPTMQLAALLAEAIARPVGEALTSPQGEESSDKQAVESSRVMILHPQVLFWVRPCVDSFSRQNLQSSHLRSCRFGADLFPHAAGWRIDAASPSSKLRSWAESRRASTGRPQSMGSMRDVA